MKTELEAEETWKKELKIWKQDKVIVKQQIAGMILDSPFMKICNHMTAVMTSNDLGNRQQS